MFAFAKPASEAISAWLLRCDRTRIRSAISVAVAVFWKGLVMFVQSHVFVHMTYLPCRISPVGWDLMIGREHTEVLEKTHAGDGDAKGARTPGMPQSSALLQSMNRCSAQDPAVGAQKFVWIDLSGREEPIRATQACRSNEGHLAGAASWTALCCRSAGHPCRSAACPNRTFATERRHLMVAAEVEAML